MKTQREIEDIFRKNKMSIGRMISPSKSDYVRRFPDHLVIFNANVLIESLGKVWWGDLDITKSEDVLKTIAKEIGEDLYILREMDYRFDTENRTFEEIKTVAKKVISHE